MSDKPRIPSWQRASVNSPPTPSSEPKEQPETSDDAELKTSPLAEAPTPTESDLDDLPSESLLDQASRFLEDAAIRDAPREKKAAFLESKGVKAEDIATLLDQRAQEDSTVDLEEAGARAWSTVSSPSAASCTQQVI